MPTRQARRERRAAERNAKKHLLKQSRLSAMAPRMDEPAVLSEAKTQGDAERKAKKAEIKSAKSAIIPAPDPDSLDLDDEFSPEFIAHARSVRERIHARAEINRANAAHSTGPRSKIGKVASSGNSLKHGLTSGTLIIPGEDPAAFEVLQAALIEEHQPATETEALLVTEMAQSWWLTQRAIRLQNDCFTGEGIDEKRLALFLRYQTTHERAFHKALNTLIRLKKQRCSTKHGFVSQTCASASAGSDEPAFLSEAKTRAKVFVSQNTPFDLQNPSPPLAEAA